MLASTVTGVRPPEHAPAITVPARPHLMMRPVSAHEKKGAVQNTAAAWINFLIRSLPVGAATATLDSNIPIERFEHDPRFSVSDPEIELTFSCAPVRARFKRHGEVAIHRSVECFQADCRPGVRRDCQRERTGVGRKRVVPARLDRTVELGTTHRSASYAEADAPAITKGQ